MNKSIPVILAQHAEEAAFLWHLRQYAIHAPHYKLEHLADLDERIEGHMDGLRIAGDAGWETCQENLQAEEAGEVFAATILATESRNRQRLSVIRDQVEAIPETASGFISALSWLEFPLAHKILRDLLVSEASFWRRIALAACANHRIDILNSGYLASVLKTADTPLRARALRAVGELGHADLKPPLLDHLQDDDPQCRFWAAWSATLVGDREKAVERLAIEAQQVSPRQDRAVNLVFRCLSGIDAERMFSALIKTPTRQRAGITAIGAHGDPSNIPALFNWMEVPELARVAGESFSIITGIDLAYEDLEGEWPEGFQAGPTENPEDDNVTMDEDEDLPWPDRKLIEHWWETNQEHFTPGRRYLFGAPISQSQCLKTLREGYQRQRQAAALELALMNPATPLFEVRAPAPRQKQALQ